MGARVLGFDSGGGTASVDLMPLARDTSATDREGEPLVFDIGRRGEGLTRGVADAVDMFAEEARFDVEAVVVDPLPGDDFDPTAFIAAVVPERASPAEGVEGVDRGRSRFLGVRPGTTLTVSLEVRDFTAFEPAVAAFTVLVVLRDVSGAELGRRSVRVVSTDTGRCDGSPGP